MCHYMLRRRRMFASKNLVLFTLFIMNLVDQPAPVVKIEQGLVSGRINTDGTVFEYIGIPYATTKRRFQAPLPPHSWNGIYKAVDEHYQCPQNVLGLIIVGMEDCLKINVFVPVHSKTALPVMVYIHGGGFVIGNGGKMLYGPEFLVRHGVILVTFNYRLGALGFLCLGIKEAPGNAGLKDQIAALRWVKKNIAAFGGDPDKVTVFGHSAGAGAISLLIASDLTDGLFSRAIIQSGSSLSSWTSAMPGVIDKIFAKNRGYNMEDPYELFKLYSEMDLNEIVLSIYKEPVIGLFNSNLVHLPCIEYVIAGEEAVITDFPYNIVMNNTKNISIIYGITDKEGEYLISEDTEKSLETLNQNPLSFSDLEFACPAEAEEIMSKVKKYYFGNKNISLETISNLSDLYGDVYISVPSILESEIYLNSIEAPIYHYYFKYAGDRNLIKSMFCKHGDDSGASHADDILYFFDAYVWPYIISKRDKKMIDWLTKMWTNFAKYGDPTPGKDLPIKWKPSTKDSLNFLYIDEELTMDSLPRPERFKFWKDIYEKYRKRRF